ILHPHSSDIIESKYANRSGKDVPFGFEKFHPYLETSVSERRSAKPVFSESPQEIVRAKVQCLEVFEVVVEDVSGSESDNRHYTRRRSEACIHHHVRGKLSNCIALFGDTGEKRQFIVPVNSSCWEEFVVQIV